MGPLLVIVQESMTALVRKGELTPRYYNPGNVFDDVHILLTNPDRPTVEDLQPSVGTARLTVHNLPFDSRLFVRTLGWRPLLLRSWAAQAVAIAREIRPALVRCYGSHLNAFLASEIKRCLGVPYVVSMHTNPDDMLVVGKLDAKARLSARCLERASRLALRNADLVLPVYQGIVPYLKRLGVRRWKVAYNALNSAHLLPKEDYRLHSPIRAVCVGRLIEGKNPDNIIRAIARMPDASLTLIGDGDLRPYLQDTAAEGGANVIFRPSVPNAEICESLKDFDIFAAHVDYYGIAKTLMEAMLVGLPVVTNRRPGGSVEELEGGSAVLVDNCVDGYYNAFQRLVGDDAAREEQGQRGRGHASECWAPEAAEGAVAGIYRELITTAPR